MSVNRYEEAPQFCPHCSSELDRIDHKTFRCNTCDKELDIDDLGMQ